MKEKITDIKKIEHILYETNKNIFLTGSGGVGKSYYIKEYIKKFPNTIVCGTTGVAAVNIGGDTVHKIFNIPVPAYGATVNGINKNKIKELIKSDTVIIDEISMLRNDAFSFAIKVLKKAERIKGKKIRLIVVGDFFQLPPVITKEDEKYLKKYKFHKSGYPFTCKEWEKSNFTVLELLTVKRQENKEFIENLNKARIGDKKCIPYFNKFIIEKELLPKDCINICGTNAEVERINNEYLDNLDGCIYAYKSKKQGQSYGKNNIVEDIILLKDNALVYFNVNDNKNGNYANGTFGIIKKCYNDYVEVIVEDKIIKVEYHKYPIYTYTINNNILTKKEIGSISQIPLRIAKAITIHKSQGKTFDKEIFSPKIFASGQFYVAVSRVRSPEGLFITEPILEDYLIIDPIIKKFYKDNYTFICSKPKNNTSKLTTNTKKTLTKKTSISKSNTKSNTKKKNVKNN